MPRTKESRERMKELRKECSRQGIRFTNRICSVSGLEAILADPYEQLRITYRRYWEIEPFDFRGKGVTPKPGAWVKWKPLKRYERQTVRGIGRFVEMTPDGMAIVRYDVNLGFGYRSRRIRISPFQIVDYSEEK